MLLLRRPSAETVREFLALQANLDFTYAAVGATASPPTGFAVNHTRVQLGEGEMAFAAAKAALGRWRQFHLGWLEAWPADTPLEAGQVVAVLAHTLRLWWLNACRIVYTVDEEGPFSKFGFAYGTLPGHAATGEERFLVDWDRESGAVWYDVLAFSRPRRLLARLGSAYLRRVQRQFGPASAAAMRQAVAEVTG